MKKIVSILLSMPVMAILLLFIAINLGIATFIENDYSAQAAKALVYHSWWMKALIAWIAIILIRTIFVKKLLTIKKFPVFLYHFSFLVIILGATITHYFGKEGLLHLREGHTKNDYLSSDTYVKVQLERGSSMHELEWKVFLSGLNPTKFNESIELHDGIMHLQSISYTPAVAGSLDILELLILWKGKRKSLFLKGGVGHQGIPIEFDAEDGTKLKFSYGSILEPLHFNIKLDNFLVERYPGSNSPSSFKSFVTVDHGGKVQHKEIYMNHVLDYQGFRLFQSSFDQDEKGSIFSVSKDQWGTNITYLGYFLMVLGMLWAWIGSFVHKRIKPSIRMLSILLLFPLGMQAEETNTPTSIPIEKTIPQLQADYFGGLYVQDLNGRIKPVNTFSNELIRKVTGKSEWQGMDGDQLLLSMLSFPQYYQHYPMIKVADKKLAEELGIKGSYAAYIDFFHKSTTRYKLQFIVSEAYNKASSERGTFEKEALKVDERLNIVHLIFSGNILRIFPNPKEGNDNWYGINQQPQGIKRDDSLFIAASFPYFIELIKNKSYKEADEVLEGLSIFQNHYGGNILPSKGKINAEISYNKAQIFVRLMYIYGFFGMIFLLCIMVNIFRGKKTHRLVLLFFTGILWFAFLLHTAGLIWRWYISGHAPWSNGFESMIYISWVMMLAGLSFSGRIGLSSAATAFLAAITLAVAHMSWMDPTITPLVPVLKSYWLSIHVSVIISSYGFLALSALLGFFCMIMMIGKPNDKRNDTINYLVHINRRSMKLGLYLLTIGTFLGGIWANESWGRYWGWDPKETWALISIIVYAFVIHLKYIPKMHTRWSFSLLSWLSFSTILMTYFGVNYYLSGLHSYAGGDPIDVPVFAYYLIFITFAIAVFSRWFEQRSPHS